MSLFGAISQFVKERAKWIAKGRPYREGKEVLRIYNICAKNKCGHFTVSKCTLCGCNIHPTRTTLNKLAWATTECPHEEKYWEAEEEYRDSEENIGEDEIKTAQLEHENESKSGGCGCGG